MAKSKKKPATETGLPVLQYGYLDVSHGHRLYYELCGNADGIPVIFFHGGPGGGFSDRDKDFFSGGKYKVLFFDQRGAGRSQPFASTKGNTTKHLLKDTIELMDLFDLKKALVFGGSWGSTLGLAFAITHPERVLGLVLRGIFLANKESDRHYLSGGVAKFFPDVWKRFVALVPSEERDDVAGYYFKKMRSSDKEIARRYCYEWAFYESSIARLRADPREVAGSLENWPYEALAILEAHYITQGCFLEDNFILRNARKLKHLPVSIVHGRYDFVCLPKHAFQLHEKLPGSRLHVVVAGHSAHEPAIKAKLVSELKRLAKVL